MLWDDAVRAAAEHWGQYYGVTIDPALVHGVMQQESWHGTHPRYVKHRGIVPEPGGHVSYGPMQVYDTTAKEIAAGIPPARLAAEPALGIWYGVKYLGRQLQRYGGDAAHAAAAYNAGSVRRTTSGKYINQGYVDAVLRFWKQYATVAPLMVGPAVPIALAAFVAWLMMAKQRWG